MQSHVIIVALAENITETSDLRRLLPLLCSHGVVPELWGWDAGTLCRVGFGLSRGSLAGRLKLLIAYSWWILRIFFRALLCETKPLYFCVMFEAALPIALASVFKKITFVFANMDNAPLHCPWAGCVRRLVEYLERFVAKKACIHQLPTPVRWKSQDANVRFVENAPSRPTYLRALHIAKERGYQRESTLTLYVNGWLSNLRGIAPLLKAIHICKHPIRVILAGQLMCPDAEVLANLDCCEYLGVLQHEEAIAVYTKAHLVFTYYDPVLEIDRLASSGKWSECVLVSVPFVVNSEVETVGKYRDAGACFSTPYADAEALSALLDRLADDRREWESVRMQLSQFKVEFWDDKMLHVLRDAGCELAPNS